MEAIHTILVYPALWWGCIVTVAGAQNMNVPKYNNLAERGKDVKLLCYFPSTMWSSNCQWYFTGNEAVERLLNGTRYTWSCGPINKDHYWVPIELLFKNATFTDTGKYICETTASTGNVRGELSLNVHAKPQITVPKTNYKTVVGTDVTLECMVNASGDTNISTGWQNMFNQQWNNVTNSNKYYWTTQMPSLVISKVMTTDSGFYRCFASTPLYTDVGSRISLQVQDRPLVTVQQTQFFIVSGEDVVLNCIVNGRGLPIINVIWYKQSQALQSPQPNNTKYRWRQQGTDASITITKATETDAGIYVCEGTTEAGSSKGGEIELRVGYRPLVTVQQTQFFIVSGEDVVLNCIVDGRGLPIINVKWYKQSQALQSPQPNNAKYRWSQQGPDASIRITNATETDAGIYVCEGRTEAGSSKGGEIELRAGYKPTVTVNEYNYIIGMGDNLTLHCYIDRHGSVVKMVEWFKQYRYIQSSTRAFWDISSPSLKIIGILDDAGKYTCKGLTECGTTERLHICVQVFYIPTVRVNEYTYSIRTGDNLTLHCSIDGHDSTVKMVEWLKQENSQYRYLQPSTRVFWDISNPSLKIINVSLDDAGNYTCKGTTEVGMAKSQQISVQVFDLPVISQQDRKDLNGSSSEKYVVPVVSVVACVAMIALVVVVILIRKKRLKDRTDQTNSGKRSTNGQQQPSPSINIHTGNDHAKFYADLSGDMTYAQVIRKSNKDIGGDKSTGDTNISQFNTHIDGSNNTRNIDTSQVYMNINNTYATVQQRSSTSNSRSNIQEATESENTQVDRTEELNYTELEFSSDAQDENSSLVIRGCPSDTTYTDVVVFTR